VTWIGRSTRELIKATRASLPRELPDKEQRRFYLTVA
jgi:hypothetical protein